jgi:mannan endo-1,4-beta-mannosidase
MKYRPVTVIAFLVAVTATALTTRQLTLPHTTPIVEAKLPPKSLSYLGVFEPGSPPAYRPVAKFSDLAGRRPNLVGYYSGWAEPFNKPFADMVRKHGVTPFVQIDPRFAKVPAIVSGAYDDYLRSYAISVRNFGHPIVIGFGHEMNASWYPWGYQHVPATTFVAAWRHIVNVFNSQGAKNVTWLWTINQDLPGSGPIASWWPGTKYVTWVGIDGYYFAPSDTFKSVFGTTIQQVRKFTMKPILLSETAVGPGTRNQFAMIGNLFSGMQKYKTLGLVWFDKDQANFPKDENDAFRHQNWHLQDGSPAGIAFRLYVSRTLSGT